MDKAGHAHHDGLPSAAVAVLHTCCEQQHTHTLLPLGRPCIPLGVCAGPRYSVQGQEIKKRFCTKVNIEHWQWPGVINSSRHSLSRWRPHIGSVTPVLRRRRRRRRRLNQPRPDKTGFRHSRSIDVDKTATTAAFGAHWPQAPVLTPPRTRTPCSMLSLQPGHCSMEVDPRLAPFLPTPSTQSTPRLPRP